MHDPFHSATQSVQAGDNVSILTDAERLIIETAYALYTRYQLPGACYHYSFFLHYYLRRRFRIEGRVQVGFIEHEATGRCASHAWYSYRGTITDLAVSRPLNTHETPPGPLVILGQAVSPGAHWRYLPHGSKLAQAAEYRLRALADADAENERHAYALAIHFKTVQAVQSMAGIRAYLDEAPPGLKYRDMAALIEKPGQPQTGSGYRPLQYLL